MNRNESFAMIALLLFSLALRSIYCSADAPMELSWSQGESTDGFWYLEGAVERLETGSWQHRQNYNKYIFSALAYGVFALFGVGNTQANMVSLIPGLFLIIFLILILHRFYSFPWALLGGFLAGINYILIFYSRIPLIYMTMTTSGVIAFYLWVIGEKRWWIRVISGIWLILAILYIKEIVGILLPVFLMGLILEIPAHKRLRWGGRIFVALVGGVGLFWAYTRYNPAFLEHVLWRIRLYRQNSLEWDEWLTSLFQFGQIDFFDRMPFIALFSYMGLLFSLWYHSWKDRITQHSEILPVLWLFGGIFAFVLLRYRPLRYLIVLIPPMILLSIAVLHRIWTNRFDVSLRFRKTIFALWAAPLVFRFIGKGGFVSSFAWHITLSIALCVIFTLLLWKPFHYAWQNIPLSRRILWRKSIVLIAILGELFVQGRLYLAWAISPSHSVSQAMIEIAPIVGKDAFLIGPYAHLLTFGSSLKKSRIGLYPHIDKHTCESLMAQPFSHFTVDTVETAKSIEKDYPHLWQCMMLLDTFYIRGFGVRLFELKKIEANQSIAKFAKGRMLMQQEKWDEAKKIFSELVLQYPKHSLMLKNFGICHFRLGSPEEAEAFFQEALRINPSEAQSAYFLGLIYANRQNMTAALQMWAQAKRSAMYEPILQMQIRKAEHARIKLTPSN